MWLEATPIKVITRRENGSGVIEIPIAATSQVFGALTVDIMRDFVANFDSFPIVPVGVSPHRDFGDRAGFSPAFINSVELRDDMLFGRLDLIAPLFAEVVELGGWRGFSVEARKNLKTTIGNGEVTRNISGWVLVGGVFTNRPAVDSHFKIAAEGSSGNYSVPITPVDSGGDDTMSDHNKPAPGDGAQIGVLTAENKALEADKKTLGARVTTLGEELRESRRETEGAQTDLEARTTELATARAQINTLEAEQRGTKDANKVLTASVKRLEGELQTEAAKNLSANVREIIETAIKPIDGKQGVPPRVFEGWEADPAAYLQARFKDLESFKTFVSALPGAGMEDGERKTGTQTNSGHAPGTDPAAERDADEITLTAAEEAVLERLGLPAEYDGVMDEVTAGKVHKKLEAAKASK